MSESSIYEILADKIKRDHEDLNAVEKVTKKVYPAVDSLSKRDIVNPVILKIKLSEVDPKYRDPLYGLYRIAIDGGPEGSFIMLDSQKVLYIIDDIEMEEDINDKGKKGKKFIIGITKKVVKSIKALIVAELSALCHLVNNSVVHRVINVPSDSLRGIKAKPQAQQISSNNTQSR